MSEPTIAIFLLQRFCRDEALVGDILEEFAHRRSRAWLWKQVAFVVLVGLPYGLMKEPRPASKMPMPIGGIGLIAIVLLITFVSPGAWWLIGLGVAGGTIVAVALVFAGRRRGIYNRGRGNILLPLILVCAAATAAAADESRPAVRIDAVDGIVEAFKTHQVVMLPGGHGSKPLHDLLLAVARDPRMPGTLTDIVVEFGGSRYQDAIDRFIRGEDVPDKALRQIWQNTVIAGIGNDGPYVEEFYRAIRALNATLPAATRYRVLAGDPPIDWDHVTTKADVRKWVVRRDTFPADLIHREVVERGRRALVVYGQGHFHRKQALTNYDMTNWQAQTMSSLLEAAGIRPFVILSDAGKQTAALQADIASWPAGSLSLVGGTVLGAADFTVFVGDGDRYAIRGVDDFVKIPKEQHKPMRMEEQADAILWMGLTRSPSPVVLSKETCADPDYLPMRVRRTELGGMPQEGELAKRACAAKF